MYLVSSSLERLPTFPYCIVSARLYVSVSPLGACVGDESSFNFARYGARSRILHHLIGTLNKSMQFLENVPLAPYTTFGIGGPARWFADAASEADVLEGMLFAREQKLPLFVLGGGSNLLVSDEGYPGLVLHIALGGVSEELASDQLLFRVAAGEDWDRFVSHAVARNAAGIECLAGIPGTVGGTPVQNVGAYGQEVSSSIATVRALDLMTNNFVELGRDACEFHYRQSIFNSSARGRYIVTRVDYVLTPGGAPTIAYADLQKQFAAGVAPSIAEVATAVRAIRRAKGMLLVEGDPDCKSAGSFFKNPIVSAQHFAQIAEDAAGVAVPHYPAGSRQVKIPAAWLIERAGFRKGFAMGEAGISSRHTLALINRGHARASDIAALRDAVIVAVEAKFNIRLEPEPVWVNHAMSSSFVLPLVN
jgi:UDP-N-acetylmuramate dehydrogenase